MQNDLLGGTPAHIHVSIRGSQSCALIKPKQDKCKSCNNGSWLVLQNVMTCFRASFDAFMTHRPLATDGIPSSQAMACGDNGVLLGHDGGVKMRDFTMVMATLWQHGVQVCRVKANGLRHWSVRMLWTTSWGGPPILRPYPVIWNYQPSVKKLTLRIETLY